MFAFKKKRPPQANSISRLCHIRPSFMGFLVFLSLSSGKQCCVRVPGPGQPDCASTGTIKSCVVAADCWLKVGLCNKTTLHPPCSFTLPISPGSCFSVTATKFYIYVRRAVNCMIWYDMYSGVTTNIHCGTKRSQAAGLRDSRGIFEVWRVDCMMPTQIEPPTKNKTVFFPALGQVVCSNNFLVMGVKRVWISELSRSDKCEVLCKDRLQC